MLCQLSRAGLLDDRVWDVEDLLEERDEHIVLPFCNEIGDECTVVRHGLFVPKRHLFETSFVDRQVTAILECALAFVYFVVDELFCILRRKPRTPCTDNEPYRDE